ncbi:MAG: Ig-like domain-containing protein [Gemmatimonadales bacterium]
MTNTHFNRTLCFAVLALAATLGCGDDLALPSSSGNGVDLTIVGGNDQTGIVGQELPDPLVVSVQSGGAPIPGHEVAFIVAGDAAAGRLEPDTAVTGSDGRAVAHWVLGPQAGPYEVEARLVVSEPEPPPTAVFAASALAGEPDTMRAVSVLSQPGRIGRPVAEAPTVLVVDRFGNPVGGAEVAWDVTAGGGTTSGAATATGEDGRASVTWTLGLGIGVQKLMARMEGVHGSPVTFTATVLF